MKEKILKAAMDLFMKRGVRDVNIDEVCHTLGISKKTFYQYYESKEDLAGAVVSAQLDLLGQRIRKKTEGMDEIDIMMFFSDHRNRDMNFTEKKIGDDIRKYYPETFIAHTKSKVKFLRENIRESIHRGVEKGFFRPEADTDAYLLLLGLMHKGMVCYTEGEYITEGKKLPVKSLDQTFGDIMTRSLLSEEGWKEYRKRMAEKDNNTDKTI